MLHKPYIHGLDQIGLTTGPIILFHLIKYRTEANYHSHPEEQPCTGQEAYNRYLDIIAPVMEENKVKGIYRGPVELTLIGPSTDIWDIVSITEWPTAAALKDFLQCPEYLNSVYHREAGLLDYRAYISRK